MTSAERIAHYRDSAKRYLQEQVDYAEKLEREAAQYERLARERRANAKLIRERVKQQAQDLKL